MATKLGERLKQLRIAKGLTQQALADAMGVQRTAIMRFEIADNWNPTLDTLRKLAQALGTRASELVRLADQR